MTSPARRRELQVQAERLAAEEAEKTRRRERCNDILDKILFSGRVHDVSYGDLRELAKALKLHIKGSKD